MESTKWDCAEIDPFDPSLSMSDSKPSLKSWNPHHFCPLNYVTISLLFFIERPVFLIIIIIWKKKGLLTSLKITTGLLLCKMQYFCHTQWKKWIFKSISIEAKGNTHIWELIFIVGRHLYRQWHRKLTFILTCLVQNVFFILFFLVQPVYYIISCH